MAAVGKVTDKVPLGAKLAWVQAPIVEGDVQAEFLTVVFVIHYVWLFTLLEEIRVTCP